MKNDALTAQILNSWKGLLQSRSIRGATGLLIHLNDQADEAEKIVSCYTDVLQKDRKYTA